MSEVDTNLFAGIEGGASVSKLSLFNGAGILLAMVEGPGTNIWVTGMEEVVKRIAQLVEEARRVARLPPKGMPFRSMCLSLSGAEDKKVNDVLKEQLVRAMPGLCLEFVICSDTIGPIYTIGDNGGIVLISGTGSNCLLINPDETKVQCGGWGHMLGDEGSAFWISQKAIKLYMDSQDGLEATPHNYPTDVIWQTIKDHFQISDRYDLLMVLYKEFEKGRVAQLCKEMSLKARAGDPLSRWIFEMAGRYLAKHVLAVSKQAHPRLLIATGGLPVVCVGSVWSSFDLLKPGFSKQLKEDCRLTEVSLLNLKVSASTGAAYIAAKHVNFDLPKDYSKNFEVFYHFKMN